MGLLDNGTDGGFKPIKDAEGAPPRTRGAMAGGEGAVEGVDEERRGKD